MSLHCIPGVIMLIALSVSHSFSATDSLEMYLCTDRNGASSQKTVYGYIDGKKTGCMSKYELMVAHSQARIQREKKSRTIAQWRTCVYHGEKNLAFANLKGCDLKDIDLSGADLTNAQLESADLRGANLENAVLTGANLKNAYCKQTNLKGANLKKADLRGTYFHYADLSGAEELTSEQLLSVTTLYKARIDKKLFDSVKADNPKKLNNPKNNWTRTIFDDTGESTSIKTADPSKFK